MGLLQVIATTYQANARPGFKGTLTKISVPGTSVKQLYASPWQKQPYANLYSALRYVQVRYGVAKFRTGTPESTPATKTHGRAAPAVTRNESGGSGVAPSPNMSVTSAAIADRSERVSVMWANSGWPLSFSTTATTRRGDPPAGCRAAPHRASAPPGVAPDP